MSKKNNWINPDCIDAVKELENGDGCEIYIGQNVIKVEDDFDEVMYQWQNCEFVGVCEIYGSKPKWNHWLRKRQLWEQKKKKAPFEIQGNVPQEFKDALKNKAADVVVFRGTFQKANEMNINGRIYTSEALEKATQKLNTVDTEQ